MAIGIDKMMYPWQREEDGLMVGEVGEMIVSMKRGA